MNKPSAVLYNLDAVVRGDVAGDIVKLLQDKDGMLLRLVPHTNGHRSVARPARARYVPPKKVDETKFREARDIVYGTLKQIGGQVPRKLATKALVSRGYSARSVGPICALLQKDGVIYSPKRGFWQVK